MTDVQPQPSPSPAPAPSPTASESAAPAVPSPTPARPEGLPDHYWDEKTGPRLNELVTDFNKLATEHSKQAEVFKDFPAKVEDAGAFYTLPEKLLPDDLKLPADVKIEPDKALLDAALPLLHKYRADPGMFQDLARAVTTSRAKAMLGALEDARKDNEKLGASATARRQDLANRIAAAVGPERAKFINTAIITSDAVMFFEDLFSKLQGNVVPIRQGQPEPPPAPPQTVEDRWYKPAPQKAS